MHYTYYFAAWCPNVSVNRILEVQGVQVKRLLVNSDFLSSKPARLISFGCVGLKLSLKLNDCCFVYGFLPWNSEVKSKWVIFFFKFCGILRIYIDFTSSLIFQLSSLEWIWRASCDSWIFLWCHFHLLECLNPISIPVFSWYWIFELVKNIFT